jgi:adenosylcobinamide-phosphate synthase
VSVLLALVVDAIWGEPPVRWHPVVWMGTYLQRVGRSLPDFAPRKALLLGAAYWLLGALVVA